jgi:hypothetical protein
MDAETKNEMRKVLEKCWSFKTSVCFNPDIAPLSYGQCAPSAIVTYEKFGGEILKTVVKKHDGNSIRHFYNYIDGQIVDLTADQFDIPEYWCELTYDNTASSLEDALTEMLSGQIEAMRSAFREHSE